MPVFIRQRVALDDVEEWMIHRQGGLAGLVADKAAQLAPVFGVLSAAATGNLMAGDVVAGYLALAPAAVNTPFLDFQVPNLAFFLVMDECEAESFRPAFTQADTNLGDFRLDLLGCYL